MNQNIYQKASDPQKSIWVSASAGSGKTKTLIDRFLRLILSGTAPEKILCVTFTKVAASEMLTRIREILARWTYITDAELKKELKELNQYSSLKGIKKARSLFSHFIGNQENLQIQTLHSFCQKLISTFPLEAGLKINPEIITEYQRSALTEQTKNFLLENYETETKDPTALNYLLSNIHESTLDNLLERASYISHISNLSAKEGHLNTCYKYLGATPETCKKALMASHNNILNYLKSNINILKSNSAPELDLFINPCLTFIQETQLDSLKSTFLTSTGSPRKTLLKKKHTSLFTEVSEILYHIRDLVYQHSQNEAIEHTLYCSIGFIDLLFLFNKYFSDLKKELGYLDYDDIISISLKMLENEGLSRWIETKLNAKIEHVMVDESQDINLKQWQIIHACIKDFFSSNHNTLFIVGDHKQSIYSFQGSSPELFAGIKQLLHNKASEFDQELHSLDFKKSFRSDKLILDFVDSVFSTIEKTNTNYFCENNLKHISHQNFDHASIELWPLFVNAKEKNKANEWDITTNYQDTYTASKTLAKVIAKKIETLINKECFIPADFMILVRKRDLFTNYMVNSLKEKNIPVSGMDRILLQNNIAVKDLISLMQFIVTPEDDYNLACLLKSPIFNISEDDLLYLCQREKKTLWEKLKKKPKIQKYLSNLLTNTAIHQPHKLTSYCLDIQGKRRSFLSSLGMHVTEILDEFLEICLEFESTKTSSLLSFIQWFRSSNIEVKKELDVVKNEVKVMTIHASKGLQSKYVILPDTTTVPKNKDQILFDQLNDIILYNVSENHDKKYQNLLKNTKLRTLQEYYRLLYVGLTRAKTHLLICGHSSIETLSDLSWYSIIQKTLQENCEKKYCDSLYGYKNSAENIENECYFISNSDYTYQKKHGEQSISVKKEQIEESTPLPNFLLEEYQDYKQHISTSPSEKAAVQYTPSLEMGKLTHKMLEYFVPLKRKVSKEEIKYFSNNFRNDSFNLRIGENLIQNLYTLINTELLPLTSGKKVIPELKISKKYSSKNQVYNMLGAMDLVVFSEDTIYIIDYKTDKNIPESSIDIPAQYIKQLSLYKDMLQSSYQDKKIVCYLAWTHIPGLTKLDDNLLLEFKDLELI